MSAVSAGSDTEAPEMYWQFIRTAPRQTLPVPAPAHSSTDVHTGSHVHAHHTLGPRSFPVSPSLRRAGNMQSGWKGDPAVVQVVPLLLMGDTFEKAAALGRLNWRPDVVYVNPPRGRGFVGDLTAAYELLKCGGLLAGHGYHLDQVHKPLATFSRKVRVAQPRRSWLHITSLNAILSCLAAKSGSNHCRRGRAVDEVGSPGYEARLRRSRANPDRAQTLKLFRVVDQKDVHFVNLTGHRILALDQRMRFQPDCGVFVADRPCDCVYHFGTADDNL